MGLLVGVSLRGLVNGVQVQRHQLVSYEMLSSSVFDIGIDRSLHVGRVFRGRREV